MQIPATQINASGSNAMEVAYTQFTSAVNITANSEATADTIVTATAFSANGTSAYLIEFFAERWSSNQVNGRLLIYLYDGGSSIGLGFDGIMPTVGAQTGGVYVAVRIVPSAGTKTYSWRGSCSLGTTTVNAGAGGNAATFPGFIRISKVT